MFKKGDVVVSGTRRGRVERCIDESKENLYVVRWDDGDNKDIMKESELGRGVLREDKG